MTATWWLLALLLPLAAAGARALLPRANALAVGVQTASLLPGLALAVLPPTGVTRLDWAVVGLSFEMDAIARALTAVAVVLYGVALVAIARREPRASELSAFLLACAAGNIGAFTAADAVTFYLFFTLMSYAAVGLVMSTRTPDARRAAVVYLVLAVTSETASLAGLILLSGAGGLAVADAPAAVAASPAGGLITALLLVGFGIKAGLVPLHVWLPLAHPAAPPAASAVLSGAMVKAGIVGWLRFLPLGEASMPAGHVLVGLGVIGAFGAVIVGLGQTNPKTVLAYSTVSQLGYLTIVIGIALVEPALAAACVNAVVIYAVHHGLAKGATFLGVSVWQHQAVGRRRWLVVAGWLVAGAAVVGAPLSGGSVGKYATKYAIEGIAIAGVQVMDVLAWVATGSTLLLLRVAVLLHASRTEPRPARDPEFAAWLVLVAASATLPWVLTGAWVPVADVPELDPVTLWDAAWPVLVGLGFGAIGWTLRGRLARLPVAPAGDLVVIGEAGVRAAGRTIGRLPSWTPPSTGAFVESSRMLLRRAEGQVSGWTLGLGLLVGLIVLIALTGGWHALV